ncbi:hypothetical protein F5Y09DRAFT_293546 [Xylaria sp. FL1042]|nr:hypothetical protein F5Y09DRAFT_293183 [Xylaria sp. FL1042]KAI0435426.1 hypothetical protein F5Y09DRAFT_293546 [Xylaria sp. FL1042]
MATPLHNSTVSVRRAGNIDDDSDYGSDFSVGEEQLVDKILADLGSDTTVDAIAAIAATAATTTTTYTSTTATTATTRTRTSRTTTTGQQNHNGEPRAPFSIIAGDSSSRTASPISPSLTQAPWADSETASASRLEQGTVSLDSIRYPDLSRALSNLEPETPPVVEGESDPRTPLQRFRSFPRRPLTVSDFAAGAWCELQHWYTLTRLPGGKKTMTVAMKGGSRVHQTLEDEVHSTIEVSIASKEEAFALRLWNIIQGMRTLRDTGITRELEVWGIIDGEVLNGVIDQLSHSTPNASFEEELNLPASKPSTQQSSITDYMAPSHKTVYLTDVKTRGSDRLPSGTAIRPARVQLLLYHRLLSDMAANRLDYTIIFERYGLNGEARFSDGFMAQIGGLHDEIFYDADSEFDEKSSEKEYPDLIGYRSISQIIPLLKAEFKETFPLGSASISDLLAVEYLHRSDGRLLGNNSFAADPEALDIYMKDNLRWWRGEREPEGVTIEETYKCGWCEFAESCQWRKDKELEHLKKKRKAKTTIKPIVSKPSISDTS